MSKLEASEKLTEETATETSVWLANALGHGWSPNPIHSPGLYLWEVSAVFMDGIATVYMIGQHPASYGGFYCVIQSKLDDLTPDPWSKYVLRDTPKEAFEAELKNIETYQSKMAAMVEKLKPLSNSTIK